MGDRVVCQKSDERHAAVEALASNNPTVGVRGFGAGDGGDFWHVTPSGLEADLQAQHPEQGQVEHCAGRAGNGKGKDQSRPEGGNDGESDSREVDPDSAPTDDGCLRDPGRIRRGYGTWTRAGPLAIP